MTVIASRPANLTLAFLTLCVALTAPVRAQDRPVARHIPASEAAAIIDKALASKQPQLASSSNYNMQVLRRAEARVAHREVVAHEGLALPAERALAEQHAPLPRLHEDEEPDPDEQPLGPREAEHDEDRRRAERDHERLDDGVAER